MLRKSDQQPNKIQQQCKINVVTHKINWILKRIYIGTLTKLILNDDCENLADSRVRHYDIQCEGAQMINGLLTAKLKGIYYKFFDSLKQIKKSKIINSSHLMIKDTKQCLHKQQNSQNQFLIASKMQQLQKNTQNRQKQNNNLNNIRNISKQSLLSQQIYNFSYNISLQSSEIKHNKQTKFQKRIKILNKLKDLDAEFDNFILCANYNDQLDETQQNMSNWQQLRSIDNQKITNRTYQNKKYFTPYFPR